MGDKTLSLDFARTGDFTGTARLLVDGDVVGEGAIATTARYLIAWQGIFLGRDALSPVSFDYPSGFDFSGTIHHVDYTIANDSDEIAPEVFD